MLLRERLWMLLRGEGRLLLTFCLCGGRQRHQALSEGLGGMRLKFWVLERI